MMLKRFFNLQHALFSFFATLFFVMVNGIARATSTGSTGASSILFSAVPDPVKWLNEFQSRVNNTGIVNGVVGVAFAFIGAIVSYKIVRGLMEKNNAKIATAVIYCVISTVALGFSKPDNGWQQTMRQSWGNMIAYSQNSVGKDITEKMDKAMTNFGNALMLLPVFGFAKIGTGLKMAKVGEAAIEARGAVGALAVKDGEAVIGKTVSVTAERALGSIAVGATLINSYAYLIYYSGMTLVICSIAIPLTCIFIASGNWKPIAAIFMTMIGCIVLAAIAPIIFVEVIEISYIRPLDAAIDILTQMSEQALAAATAPSTGGFQLPNLNPIDLMSAAFEKVTTALAIAASALMMLLALVIGGVAIGIQLITKLPDVVYGTLKS
jgi:hypothetical protein